MIQGNLAAFTAYMFQHMPDWRREGAQGAPPKEPPPQAAARAGTWFLSLSPEIRGFAILGPRGLLASSDETDEWLEPARALLAAADDAAGGFASHAHVATEEGEAYAVRHAGLAIVAVTERFTLASLVLADMRAALRDLVAGAFQAQPEAA